MVLNSAIVAGKPSMSSRGTNKGAEIRARIAANRAKRLRIADAMKREAGVTEHTVHKEDSGGLAYIGTGNNSGPGYAFPGHVKEFEAYSLPPVERLRSQALVSDIPYKPLKQATGYASPNVVKECL